MERHNEKGQALMIVLLALAAVASIALTISTRTTTDVSVTTNVEDSQRAFTAAEAGIEKVLLDQNTAIGTPLQQAVGDAGATFTASANSIPVDNNAYAYPFELQSGDTATLWFMSHDTNNQLTCSGMPCYTGNRIVLCWGRPDSDATQSGALEVSVYYQDTDNALKVARTTIDPDFARKQENKFTLEAGTGCTPIDGQSYSRARVLNFADILGITNYSTPGSLKMMRVRILYNSLPQPIGFRTQGAGSIPAQGIRVDSLGSAGTSARRLEAYSLYPVTPSMFDAALFSPPGVTKN